jgi:hypothetical protein
MDQHQIDSDASIQPQITTMESKQQELNGHINLSMSSKVWYLRHVQDSGPRDVNGPRLGDDIRLLPFFPSQILVRCDHAIFIAVS